jgi:hypothetical protein
MKKQPKPLPLKQQLLQANNKLLLIFYEVYKALGEDKPLELILAGYESDLYDLECDIENEEMFAEENRTGTYKSAGTEARKQLKRLSKLHKERTNLINSFKAFILQHSRLTPLW